MFLSETASLLCNFHLSMAAPSVVCADPSLKYACILLGVGLNDKGTRTDLPSIHSSQNIVTSTAIIVQADEV